MNDEKKRKLAELDRLSREQDELFRQHDTTRSEIYGLGVFFRLFRQKAPRRPISLLTAVLDEKRLLVSSLGIPEGTHRL